MKAPKDYKLMAQAAYEAHPDSKIEWSKLSLEEKDKWFKVAHAVVDLVFAFM